ncbi:flavin reductase family protein [Streptomyces fulvoviolaceus]|uniref:flavin reductase family protein n=1 Tax=Streptomyces fulvoviolaceus TaxID=285535 RepID=UPI001F2C99D3|nr:flavin reductase family protein [Streptomyces fulvoviolaceus]
MLLPEKALTLFGRDAFGFDVSGSDFDVFGPDFDVSGPDVMTPQGNGTVSIPAGEETLMSRIADLDSGRAIREHEFRAAVGCYASGLTVVAALDEMGNPAGLTCQSFSSLSLEPPLILVCIGRRSSSWARIEPTGRFGVSILAEEQQEICAAIGRSGGDKFGSIDWHASADGAVHIEGALATINCRISTIHDGGDHLVVIGEVMGLTVRDAGAPLLYFRGNFGTGAS